jgi:pilus assembly protein CpaD
MSPSLTRTPRRLLAGAITLSLGLALSACGTMPANHSLESVRQPVVARTNYTLDVQSGPDGLSIPEQRRLAGWFEAMDLRYGDRIAIDDPSYGGAARASVEAVAARYGLLVSDTAPVTPGAVPPGAARVVVTRTTASVPGCPDWSMKSDFSMNNATSPGYGCAINGNLASMVADPEHLIHGEKGTGETTVLTSSKAIDSYRQAKPTGEQGLKQTSTENGGK